MITPGRLAVQREYEGRLWGLYRFAVANGLTTVDDILARAASQGRYSAEELISLVKRLATAGDGAELSALLQSLRSDSFRRLVLLLANQPQRPNGVADATAVLEAIAAHGVRDALDVDDKMTLLDLLSAQGRRDDLDHYIAGFRLERTDAVQLGLLRANAVHPFRTGEEDRQSEGVESWLELINRVYARDGLEPIDLAPGTEPPLDRIMCAPSSRVEDGPLVTVIVPTHDPGPALRTALESLLNQSYRPLQILVMDDGSRPDLGRALHQWEGRDARITVVNLPQNRGTYYARNVALSQYARGDYITVHDDDDWSHPRKIELQLAQLAAEPDLPANMSPAVRATANLWLDRRTAEPRFVTGNYSSLMIRRSVMAKLGYWDLVNRAADGELRDRIAAWWGDQILVVGRAPLSMPRVRLDSLSHGEIYRGYVDPRRRWYTMAHRHWHEQTVANRDSLYVAPDDSSSRPFPAPVDMLGPRMKPRPTEVDVLYVTDYRFPGGNSTLSCIEIEVLLAHGFTVGMLQLDSPVVSTYAKLHPRVFELAKHPNAQVLTTFDSAAARLTIIRHPTVLQFIQPARLPVTAAQVVLIVNHAPVNPDRKGAVYDIQTVVANCEAAFGRAPVVVPESGLMRSLLDGRIDPALLADEDWNGTVPLSPREPRQAAPSRPPVIGRHSRDHLGKWPTADVLRLVYPIDGSRDVRILGGADFAQQRLGKSVDGAWTVYPFGSRPAAEFLAELDFWVYFHGPDLYESFGMATVEAMAAGLAVVLPPFMEATFGDGAIYAEPADVARVIDELWADPEAYTAQSARAVRTVQERFGEAALLARVEKYLG